MKRIGLILTAILLMAFPMFSHSVSIPDTAFRYALIDEGVDINGDSQVSFAEAKAITSLNISTEPKIVFALTVGYRKVPLGKIKNLLVSYQ